MVADAAFGLKLNKAIAPAVLQRFNLQARRLCSDFRARFECLRPHSRRRITVSKFNRGTDRMASPRTQSQSPFSWLIRLGRLRMKMIALPAGLF